MTVFFISDTHFGDHRVLNLYPRPFASVGAMDAEMIARWNAAIGEDDEIWHLGDFARTLPRAAEILPRLNGRKHLVAGNNDPQETRELEGWESVQSYLEMEVDRVSLVLCHYPFRSWRGMGKGWVNLHGHSHGKLKPQSRQFDVGVDVWGFRPVMLEEILHNRR